MHIEIDCPDHGVVVEALLEGCVLAAQAIVQAGVVPPFPVDIPSLRFIPEQGTEKWLLPHQVMKAGGGDCEDLAIWTAAGYRATGLDAGATARVMQTGKHTLHCVVQLSDGTIEDPALVLKRRELRPTVVSGWPMGDTVITDHRTGGAHPTSTLPPAAANPNPTATPQMAAALKYMKDHGLSTLSISPAATKFMASLGPSGGPGDLLTRGDASHPQFNAINNLQYESPSNPTARGFGKAKSTDAESGDGLAPYDDGQGGLFWARPTQAELAMQDPYGSAAYQDPFQGGAYGQDPYGMYGYGGYPFAPQSSQNAAADAWAEYQYMAMAMQPAYRDGGEGYAGYGSSAYGEPALTYADVYGAGNGHVDDDGDGLFLDEESMPNVIDAEGYEVDPAQQLADRAQSLAADAQGAA